MRAAVSKQLMHSMCAIVVSKQMRTADRILDPTAAAKSVGIGDWWSGARLAALG